MSTQCGTNFREFAVGETPRGPSDPKEEKRMEGLDMKSLEAMFPDGPSLEDFVSTNVADLPTFDPRASRGAADENRLVFSIYVDGAVDHASFEGARKNIVEIARESTRGHLWHRDPFTINEHVEGETYLHGSLCFGDCIDDEWFAVSIVTEATKRDPRLSAIARDNDGEVRRPCTTAGSLFPIKREWVCQ